MGQFGLPGVSINVENGALGRVATTRDGVAGLILVGVSKPLIPLYSPKQIFGLKEAESLGLTEAGDTAGQTDTWLQIKEFYTEAGNGAELWIMTVAVTKTMTEILDVANTTNGARKMLDAAQGKICILGISIYIAASYNVVTPAENGLTQELFTAIQAGQALAIEYRNSYKPFSVLLGGNAFTGVVADLADMRTLTASKVSVVLLTTKSEKKAAAVGLVLGRAAKLPVQRNIGRVKDGNLSVGKLYLTNGLDMETFSDGQIGQISLKGYIVPRRFVGKAGYYLADDPTCTSANDDYLTLANNRVIDKALKIVYATYINEINDEVEITAEGKLAATKVAFYKQLISNALNLQMQSVGEISNFQIDIDADQNVLANDKINIIVRITPVGYVKEIVVSLGFKNPASN